MNFTYLLKHSSLFPSVIGINYSQFEALYLKFVPVLRQAEAREASAKPRLRAPGAGRKPVLKTDRQKLFFILFYYKAYPTFRLCQALFCLDKSNCCRWKDFLEPILFEALGYQLDLPKVKARFLDQILEVCPLLREFLIDASERPINRPQDNDVQKYYYSGKKKTHTVKNQIIVRPKDKRILAVSNTVEGKRHDKKLAEDDGTLIHAPPGSVGLADTGYQGIREINPLLKVGMPQKKPKGEQLTQKAKESNQKISSIRVRVEHPFAWMKHFNILSHKFRNKIHKADLPFKNIACLYNFCLTHH